jgi:hypothetical protein
MCDKAIGSSISDSYLNYDCNQFCWVSTHITYVVPASFCIIAYIPLAILYRTLWQEQNTEINIQSSSIYLVVKNIISVALVIIGKILKDSYPLAHGIVFLIIVFMVFLFIFWVKTPFNFDRANLWLKLFTCCILWNTLVCIFSLGTAINNIALIVLQILGWFCILVIGVIIQSKMPPSLLVTKRGRNISDLFKFAFGLASFQKSNYGLQASNSQIDEIDSEIAVKNSERYMIMK